MIKNVLLAFIPVFVAVDAVGVLPLFVLFTRGTTREERAKVIRQSMITGICLAVAFVFLGKVVFNLLGITMGDFMVAGGAILFCIAIMDIIKYEKESRIPHSELGVVPLGTPLIVGPAVLTTSLIIIQEYGAVPAMISIVVNILLAGLIFSFSDILIMFFGESGAKALSKIMSLLLGSIAVMMIRKGIIQSFHLLS